MVDKGSTASVQKVGAVSPDLEAQRAYVKEVEAKGTGLDLVIADAFVRGMRDAGYKSSSWALSELIDNAIEAEAKNVHVALFDTRGSVGTLAVIDDGHGMDPEMVQIAVTWGGGHRGKQPRGLGKYGFGLPTSSVSIGRRFTVFSRVEGGEWHAATVDLDDIMEGKLTRGHRVEAPSATPAELPASVQAFIDTHFTGALVSGTVVLIEKLDRIRPKKVDGLRNELLEHFGLVHRNSLEDVRLDVNGVRTEPLDPLFLTPGWRYFDLDEDRAVALDPLAFDVKDKASGENLGTVKVRYSAMPAGFARVPEDKKKPRGGKTNSRLPVMDANNGLIILREGRQIDVVRSKRDRGFTVDRDDRYWGVEIDFPATLDEEFSITTAKQQIRLSDRMWDLLQQHGVFNAIKELRRLYTDSAAKLKAEPEKGEPRASEEVMTEVRKHKTRKPEGDVVEREREAKEELEREVRRRSKISGVSEEIVERELVGQQEDRPYIIETESMVGAPFYRVRQRGASRVMYLNTAHRFFSRLYAEADDRVRAALEVLLWVIGDTEIDAGDERRRFYEVERAEWSMRLNTALEILDRTDGATDLVAPVEAAAVADAETKTAT